MTLPVVRGRTFTEGELNAAIVSESAALAIWPNQDPVGKIWTYANANRTVVGVVKDSGANRLTDAESIEAYIPIEGPQIAGAALILHSQSDPAPLLRLISSSAEAEAQTSVITLMRTYRERILEGRAKFMELMVGLGAVASALAAAGMFALVAFAVAQRRREFGIRIAIGAQAHHVLNLLLAQNAKPVLLGTIAGSALAIVIARVVRSVVVLQTREPIDLPGFAAGIACFLAIAVLAALSPAMRALKIDPSATLREE